MIAWRMFGVSSAGVLHSPMFGTPYPDPQFTATCTLNPEHTAPAQDCVCGVHCITRPPTLRQLARCGCFTSQSPEPTCSRLAFLAQVELSGPVLPDPYADTNPGLGDCCVRASRVRILSLEVRDPRALGVGGLLAYEERRTTLIAQLQRRYGVPVTANEFMVKVQWGGR